MCVLVSLELQAQPAEGLRSTIPPQPLEAFFVLLLYDVGLAPGAIVAVNVSNAKPANGTVVVILSSSQWALWVTEPPKPMKGGGYSGYLVSSWRQPLRKHLVARHRISATEDDRYFVGVLNANRAPLLLEGSIEYENPGEQHLPLQLVYLPETLWASSAAFVGLMLTVALLLSFFWQRVANLLHGLLVACLWLKSAELGLKFQYFDSLARDGTSPAWRYQLWQLVDKLHSIAEVLMLLMASLGWRVLRPRLSAMETRITLIGVCVAGLMAVCQICTDVPPTQSEPLISFTLFFYSLRVACYLAIIFAMNFNLQLITMHLQESPVSPAAAVLYQRQQTYFWFRRVFLVIVLRPSALLWLKVSVFGMNGGEWAVTAFAEASSWVLYAFLFATLKPPGPGRRLLELMRVVTSGDAGSQAGLSPGSPWAQPQPQPPAQAQLPDAARAIAAAGAAEAPERQATRPTDGEEDEHPDVPYRWLPAGEAEA